MALAYYNGAKVPAIGASGAVMAVMMVYVIFYPFEQFLLFWVVPVPLWALMSIYVLYDLHPILLSLAGDPMFTGVAHASHLGGLVFGFLYWRFGCSLEPLLNRVWPAVPSSKPSPLREPVIHKFVPRNDDLEDRVDEILKKISEHGRDSLTDAELDILIQAGTKYRGPK